MNDLAHAATLAPVDPGYVRNRYDSAVSYTQFVEKRINAAMTDIVRYSGNTAMIASHLGNLKGLVNDFAHANYCLRRAYLLLCEVMEWDDDDAAAAGVTVREVKL